MHNYDICAMFCIDDLILGSLGRLIMASAKRAVKSKLSRRSVAKKAKKRSPAKKAVVRKSSHKRTRVKAVKSRLKLA